MRDLFAVVRWVPFPHFLKQLLKRRYCFRLAAGFDTGPPKPPPKTFVRYRPFSMTAASVPKLQYCNDSVEPGRGFRNIRLGPRGLRL